MPKQICSEETRAKISAANMGHPFRGPLHHTEETRARLSTAMTGHVMSPEARAKLSAATMGRVMSPETRAKVSATQMGHIGASWSSEARAKHSAVQMGKKQALGSHRSPEQRERIGIASTGRICSPETRAKISIASSNSSPETRAKISAALWGGRKTGMQEKAKGQATRPWLEPPELLVSQQRRAPHKSNGRYFYPQGYAR